jgi:hypothetical protein
MVLVEEGLGVGSNVGFAVRVRVVVLVEVLLCVAVEVATTPVLTRIRPLLTDSAIGSTVEICRGGPTTSWILSATLNVANRIKLTENRFILSWMSIFIGYYDVLMKSLFLGCDLKILRGNNLQTVRFYVGGRVERGSAGGPPGRDCGLFAEIEIVPMSSTWWCRRAILHNGYTLRFSGLIDHEPVKPISSWGIWIRHQDAVEFSLTVWTDLDTYEGCR